MEANKVIYIILAVFLDGFGVRKFYAGKMVSDLLHLLSCWTGVSCIIVTISTALTSLRPADENGDVTM